MRSLRILGAINNVDIWGLLLRKLNIVAKLFHCSELVEELLLGSQREKLKQHIWVGVIYSNLK